MNLNDTPLDQVGASAHAHYKTAEKAAGKAEEHYKSAGIYLKAAHKRVLYTRGLTWPQWLAEHCPIGKSRAYEVIAIADGRKTVDEDRQRHTERHAREREEREASRAAMSERSDNQPEKHNEINERQPYAQRRVQPDAVPLTPQQEADEAHTLLLNSVILKVRRLTSPELLKLKEHLK